ncbi:hypothetical protein BDW22DRAFT_334759 [Trametopsis cervina]|nr:hypothetical protein BDW22DRAFT_334759 [Trametopsis cervina]
MCELMLRASTELCEAQRLAQAICTLRDNLRLRVSCTSVGARAVNFAKCRDGGDAICTPSYIDLSATSRPRCPGFASRWDDHYAWNLPALSTCAHIRTAERSTEVHMPKRIFVPTSTSNIGGSVRPEDYVYVDVRLQVRQGFHQSQTGIAHPRTPGWKSAVSCGMRRTSSP